MSRFFTGYVFQIYSVNDSTSASGTVMPPKDGKYPVSPKLGYHTFPFFISCHYFHQQGTVLRFFFGFVRYVNNNINTERKRSAGLYTFIVFHTRLKSIPFFIQVI